MTKTKRDVKELSTAFLLGLAALATGCSGAPDGIPSAEIGKAGSSANAVDGVATDSMAVSSALVARAPTSASAFAIARAPRAELGFAETPPAPPRYVIRTKARSCAPIDGTGGAWIGEAVTTAVGPSHAFCTYAWSPVGSGKTAGPDWTVLHAAAETDEIRDAPYVVTDVRATNAPASQVSLGSASFTIAPSSSGGTSGSGSASGLGLAVVGGPGGSQAQPSSGLTSNGRSFPEGMHGCEVCQEEIGNYLLVVLPPDALDAETISLTTDTATYALGPVTVPVFYFATPVSYAGWSYLSWE